MLSEHKARLAALLNEDVYHNERSDQGRYDSGYESRMMTPQLGSQYSPQEPPFSPPLDIMSGITVHGDEQQQRRNHEQPRVVSQNESKARLFPSSYHNPNITTGIIMIKTHLHSTAAVQNHPGSPCSHPGPPTRTGARRRRRDAASAHAESDKTGD